MPKHRLFPRIPYPLLTGGLGGTGARGGASARRDARGAWQVLRQAPKGEVAYAVGGVVVVHQLTDNTQQFFTGHQGREITALAIHPEENIIATGEH